MAKGAVNKMKDNRSFYERTEADEFENNKNSQEHLLKVHRKIIDSIQPCQTCHSDTIFKIMVEKKADGLLFNEETLNFFQYSLNIFPREFVKYAISYLMKLMSTLLLYHQDSYGELSRLIIKTAIKTYNLDKKDITLFHDKSCSQIVIMIQ